MSKSLDLLKKKNKPEVQTGQTDVPLQSAKPKFKSFKKANNKFGKVAKSSNSPTLPMPAAVKSVDTADSAVAIESVASLPPKRSDATDSLTDSATEKYIFDEQADSFEPEVVEQMVANFTILKDSLDHPEIVSDAIASILKFLKRHEGLSKLIEPEDYGIMVRALRVSYGTTITKKQGNKEKKVKTEKKVDEIMGELDGLQFDL